MKQVAKGQTLEDGTYLFTCGTCHGKASVDKSIECSWCYGGDAQRIASEMKSARGQRYYGLLKSFLAVNGKAIVNHFKMIKAVQEGKVTPVDIAYIALKFDLNFKATWEWLVETRCIAVDYDEIPHSFTVKRAYEAAREKYPLLAQG